MAVREARTRKLDAKIARKLTRSFKEPTEINGVLKIVENMARAGFSNVTIGFPRTRPGATKAVNIKEKLEKLGFNIQVDKQSFRDIVIEVDWYETKEDEQEQQQQS